MDANAVRGRLRVARVLADALLPAVVLIGYFLADLHVPARALVLDLLATLVVAPLLGTVLAAVTASAERGLWRTLERVQRGDPVAAPDLDAARRQALRAPWLAAVRTGVLWTVGLPPLLAVFSALGGHRAPVFAFALDGLVLGPLVAMATLFGAELVLRPAVAALFAGGGVDRYRGPLALSVRVRTFITTFFLGPYSVGLLAFLTYRRVMVSKDLGQALHRLVPLELYMVALTALLVGMLLAFAQGNTLDPMERLVAALRRVQEGDLDARTEVVSNDELGVLADRFNAMVQGLRDRERMREAFGRFVSPELAAKAGTGELVLGGETREVSVLFSDVRNFTAMSERMAPTQVVELMNRYFEAMVPCIAAEGGYVNKYIGDGIMAIFGAPNAVDDHAGAAVRSAIAMQRALGPFNAEQRAKGLPELAIGVGVCTGPVVVGIIGSHDRQEYTAIGDTVNTASRIEGLNKELGTAILVEEAAARRVDGRVALRRVGEAHVKGKERPLVVYEPVEVAAVPAGAV